jgi:hypothetical protein
MNNLVEEVKGQTGITATTGAAGTTAINGVVIDTQGYDGVMCVITMGAITAGAVTSAKIQTGDESDLSDAVDVTNLSVTIADDDDAKVFALDLLRPLKRYARVVVSRATQNAVVENAVYLAYKAKEQAVSGGFEGSAKKANV